MSAELDANGQIIIDIIQACWVLGTVSKDVKTICGNGYKGTGGRDATEPAYIAFRFVEEHCEILRHMQDDDHDKTLMLRERCQLNAFTAAACSDCGSKNYCMLDEPPDVLLAEAKQHWKKIKDFGRSGAKAGTPGYLQPKPVITLLHAIPESTRSECVFIELGCGPGHVLCLAQYFGFRSLSGIDISEDNAGLYGSSMGPELLQGAWVIYLFWATWAPITKQKVITLMTEKKERIRFLIVVDYVNTDNGHRRNIPLLLDSGFVVYGYKTDCQLGGSGSGNFAGIVLSHGKEAEGRKLSVTERKDCDGIAFRPP
eukprot:g70373.t1